MTPRARAMVGGGVLLVVVQALAAAVYLLGAKPSPTPAPIDAEPAAFPLTSLVLERPGHPALQLPGGGTTVLHLWATWCAPCREELPRFLALDEARADADRLVAASVDERWDVVAHFFGGTTGEVPPAVWRLVDDRLLPRRPTLPETWLIIDGEVVSRARGAQRWSDGELERWVRSARAATTAQARSVGSTSSGSSLP